MSAPNLPSQPPRAASAPRRGEPPWADRAEAPGKTPLPPNLETSADPRCRPRLSDGAVGGTYSANPGRSLGEPATALVPTPPEPRAVALVPPHRNSQNSMKRTKNFTLEPSQADLDLERYLLDLDREGNLLDLSTSS